MSLGCLQSALELYERLEMWEEMAECLQAVGRTGKAEEVLRQQLAIEETPTLWCLLGDVTKVTIHAREYHCPLYYAFSAPLSPSLPYPSRSPFLTPPTLPSPLFLSFPIFPFLSRIPAFTQKPGSSQNIVVPERKGHLACFICVGSAMKRALRTLNSH